MKSLPAILLPAAAVLLSAQAQPPSQETTDIKRVEFAGLYWGEPETEVKTNLVRRGFELDEISKEQPDFDQEVQQEADRRNGLDASGGRGVQEIDAQHGSEWMELHFVAFPGGPRLMDATYEDRSGEHGVLDAAKQKYSAVGLVYVGKDAGNFCLPEDRPRCDVDSYGFGPMMPYIWASKDGLQLYPGANAKATYDKMFEDAVKAKTGKQHLSL